SVVRRRLASDGALALSLAILRIMTYFLGGAPWWCGEMMVLNNALVTADEITMMMGVRPHYRRTPRRLAVIVTRVPARKTRTMARRAAWSRLAGPGPRREGRTRPPATATADEDDEGDDKKDDDEDDGR
ncbi:MAG: hypothetical protein M1837_002048, partial [Sclerophora amabilis]